MTPHSEVGLALISVVGFAGGLIAIFLRRMYLSDDYEADSRKIESIANGSRPDFTDTSFTPIANIYASIGLGNYPVLASLLGYFLATVVIVVALYGGGRRTATWATATYLLATFLFAGVYLGQYSKDVFLLPLTLLVVLLPRKAYWDVVLLAVMGGAAYLFRDYWALIALSYAVLRFLTIVQVRMRYLLPATSIGVVLLGVAIFVLRGRDPNYYRTSVQGDLDAATLIRPIEIFAQPIGGIVDNFVQFWLFLLPVTLPFSAGAMYGVIMLVLAFLRLIPILALRSRFKWPAAESADGAALRRALALFIAFMAVQALFEPDYGSVLRHLSPLLPLGLIMLQAMPQGAARQEALRGWSWSPRERGGSDTSVSST